MRRAMRLLFDARLRRPPTLFLGGGERDTITGNPVVDGVLVCGRPLQDRYVMPARSTVGISPKEGPARIPLHVTMAIGRRQCRMLFRRSVRPL